MNITNAEKEWFRRINGNEVSLKQCIDRPLHILGIIRTVYRQAKRELSE